MKLIWMPLFVALLFVPGCNGCKSSAPNSATGERDDEIASRGRRGLRRNPGAEQRLPRRRPAIVWTESIEDPALDPYADGEEENDGGIQSAPVPRPQAPSNSNQSFSTGKPNSGWLANGKAMPLQSDVHRVLGHTKRRGWYYGSDELVSALLKAAKVVNNKYPGAIMRVGSISKKGGGSVYPPHASHQSGRDVDIGLYCTDLDGRPVDPPGFPRFDGRLGASVDTTGQYLFDLPRNWAFVTTLLNDPKARVQWVFLDTPLKWMLLDYAARTGAPARDIDKAEKVIVRPKNSSPHANHFHIRIYCTQRDLDWGCKDYGPEWTWVKEERHAFDQNIKRTVDNIMNGGTGLESIDSGVSMPTPDTAAPPKVPEPKPIPSPGTPKYERANLPTDVDIEL